MTFPATRIVPAPSAASKKAPDDFYIDDLAQAHAENRFVAVHIDHQFCMQYNRSGDDHASYDSYNRHYENVLTVLRHHGVPMIHVAADYRTIYEPERDDKAGRTLFASKVTPFYQNQDDLTVRAVTPASTAKSYEKIIATDMLHTIKDGEIVLFKSRDSVHSNPQFEDVMARNGWDVPGYGGQYKHYCVRASMTDSAKHYGVFGFTDLIEGAELPETDTQRRIEAMTAYFKKYAPHVAMSHTAEVVEILSYTP